MIRKSKATDVNLYPLDALEFRAWLLSSPAGPVVGTACDDDDCPLARFLASHYDGAFSVHQSDYERRYDDLLYEVDDQLPLPAWAQTFAHLVDVAAGGAESPVFWYTALECLQAACSDTNTRLVPACTCEITSHTWAALPTSEFLTCSGCGITWADAVDQFCSSLVAAAFPGCGGDDHGR